MGKEPAQPGTTQHLASRAVPIACGRSRLYGSNPCPLRFQNGIVPSSLFAAGATQMHGSRHVGAVTAQHHTGIDHHKSTPGN